MEDDIVNKNGVTLGQSPCIVSPCGIKYLGTWEKAPSMVWMFVPTMEYHGGNPASTMEPPPSI